MASLGRTISLNLVAIIIFAVLYFLLARTGGSDFTGLSNTSTPLDALYFSTTVQSSVGFGDISPTSPRAKFLVMLQQFVLIIGIVELLSSGGVSNAMKGMVKNTKAPVSSTSTISGSISNVPASI
jgi:hypothetical protein